MRQAGLLSRRQLHDLGVSRSSVRAAVRAGRWCASNPASTRPSPARCQILPASGQAFCTRAGMPLRDARRRNGCTACGRICQSR
ncbi:MAG: hypothetical protein ACR2JK_18420 [Geodermatophilaceae bacterium]